MDLDSAVKKIRDLSLQKLTVIVGIDGRSGSGKSTYANNLKEMLTKARVVHLDDFDLYQGEESIQKVITEVLEPLKTSGETDQVIILEGIFALKKELLPYYDYKIWVDCPVEIGFQRGLQRDISLNGIDNSEKWRSYWLPKEEEYIRSENPQEMADAVIDSSQMIRQ